MAAQAGRHFHLGPIMHLNHVALTVTNRDRSAAFYARFFGLTDRVHDDDHLLILAANDGALLALSIGTVPPDLPRTNHFGFQAGSADQVRQLRKVFADAGITEAEWQDSGPTRVQVFDPDGYRVEAFAW
jgi:catechol 2,3-dioxygenase-like lactoylglutathione lyase family enzyme